MHAWRAHAYGPPESLRWEEVPAPPLPDGHVRIDVKAAAVNYPDVLFTAGQYQVKLPPPFTPGFEIAGVVTETQTDRFQVGTRVAATNMNGGGFATQALADIAVTYAIPDKMTFEDAAALTVSYQTAWFALHRRAAVEAGDWVLVHAGAGGVGSAAIQLAKVADARVIATTGSAEKVAVCKKLGAEVVINSSKESIPDTVKRVTDGRGVNVVIDPVGGDLFDASTKCIAFEGRIVVIGFTSGRIAEVKTNHLLLKNYAAMGLFWGAYQQRDPRAIDWVQKELYRLYVEGAIKPLVSAVRPLSEAPKAMADIASRATTGKVILKP